MLKTERNHHENIIFVHLACIFILVAIIYQFADLDRNLVTYQLYTFALIVVFLIEALLVMSFENQHSKFAHPETRHLINLIYILFPLATTMIIIFTMGTSIANAEAILLLPILVSSSLYGRKGSFFLTFLSLLIIILFDHYIANQASIPTILRNNFVLLCIMTVVAWYSGIISENDHHYRTGREQAEKQMKTEKELLAATLDSIGEAVIATDENGKIVLVNEMASKLTGWPHSVITGHHLQNTLRFVPRDGFNYEDIIETVLGKGTLVEFTGHELINKKGEVRVVDISASPIINEDARNIGIIMVIRDITEKQRNEQELLKTCKLESLGILAGGIAHDFNNLLTVITGSLSLAQLDFENAGVPTTYLKDAEKASLQARALTQQLLTFARGGAPIKKPSSIRELIMDNIHFALHGSNVRCQFFMPNDLWPVNIDEGQISQVLHNLIINAVQAMPGGGVISVAVHNCIIVHDSGLPMEEGRYSKLSITDQGAGIPEEIIPKLFDPYFATKPTGSGLGLATCYSIVKKHGGYIDVESKVGIGSTFHVYLPASTETSIGPRTKTPETTRGQGSILLMDDQQQIREVAGQMLSSLGYDVTVACDGQEAIRIYKDALESQCCFSAVILDLTVPGAMGGRETIQRLKAMHPAAKAIVISGYSNSDVMKEYRKWGFDGVINKPFGISDLSQTLNSVLQA